jgi:two-component system cell cycle response regulator CpdR
VEQGPTILFVDDDRQIRRVVAEALTLKGFRVLTTDDGYEAMRLLAQEHVDVLFTDIVMPDVDGIQLVKHAKLLRPGLHVMMATGYASRATEAAALGKLLYKPLRADRIEAEIRAMLAAG